jgi:hypothetical protein
MGTFSAKNNQQDIADFSCATWVAGNSKSEILHGPVAAIFLTRADVRAMNSFKSCLDRHFSGWLYIPTGRKRMILSPWMKGTKIITMGGAPVRNRQVGANFTMVFVGDISN